MLTGISRPIAEDVSFSLQGDSGNCYRIEASTNLVSWSPIATITCTNGQAHYSDSHAGGQTTRFYRARLLEDCTNAPPHVAIIAPQPQDVFTAPATIALLVDAADPDGIIEKIEFFDGATKIGEVLHGTRSFVWEGVSAGVHNIKARATDDRGGTTDTAPVQLNVALSGQVGCAAILLAQYLRVPLGSVTVLSSQEVTWGDASLGCPAPGGAYIQIPILGHRATMTAYGSTYDIHIGGEKVILCTGEFNGGPVSLGTCR